ncbi:glycosyltransferase family 4 protein [Salinihabitans flavidus]|uniref:glycosyltransferase family 4 protein n=1 Tax=Salinihabitans flavidus TaxID=569882 RepID=UPI001587D9F0|nr:glycosyltransferase family 4 protein [Salinihabitans flavidus]
MNIARYCGPHRISKLYMGEISGDGSRLFRTILARGVDVCHVFWREDLFRMLQREALQNAARALGMEDDMLPRAIGSVAFTSSVYDHLFTADEEIGQRRAGFAAIDGYTVSSNRLFQIYQGRSEVPAPDATIRDGVDTAHFTPRTDERLSCRPLTIGWAGNSAWGRASQGYDVKGYTRLFEPMIARLRAKGHDVEIRVADPRVGRIPFSDMPDFYRGLDIFVCTSAIEGTPNTVLEAMACGVPVISTDVGIVPEIFGPLQRRFILDPPEPDLFAAAVIEMTSEPRLIADIKVENRNQAMLQSWENTTKGWWPFWELCAARAQDPRLSERRENWLRLLMNGD